jgi:hypothetical protein
MTHHAADRTVRTVRILGAGLLSLAVITSLGGCSDEPERSTPSTVPEGTELTAGLSLAAGSGFGATAWSPAGDGCSSSGEIVTATDDRIDIAMWGPECVISEGLNGTFQRYHSIADVVDANEVDTRRVTAGTAHVFDQTYTECTNSCTDVTHRIVLLELDQPISPDRPTVMISTLGDVPVDELLEIADAVRIGT